MNKKKILLSMGTISAIALPVSMVVACSSATSIAIKTKNYQDSMQKLASGSLSMAGAWGDARFYAGDKADTLQVVGVEGNRIANDGIQAKPGMGNVDIMANQRLFKALMIAANNQRVGFESATHTGTTIQEKLDNYTGKKGLLMVGPKNDVMTIFGSYSHTDYIASDEDTKISILDGTIKEVDAFSNGRKPATSFSPNISSLYGHLSSTLDGMLNSSQNDLAEDAIATKKDVFLKINFIPSLDNKTTGNALQQLTTYLEKFGVMSTITISPSYEDAAIKLETNKIDLAFLPAHSWHFKASESSFIMQAARPTQITTLDFSKAAIAYSGQTLVAEEQAVELFNKYGQLYLQDVTTVALAQTNLSAAQQVFKTNSKTGSLEEKITTFADDNSTADKTIETTKWYESWIYTKKDSKINNVIFSHITTPNWRIDYDDIKDLLAYGYTSKTSPASYAFSELWFQKHFIGFNGF